MLENVLDPGYESLHHFTYFSVGSGVVLYVSECQKHLLKTVEILQKSSLISVKKFCKEEERTGKQAVELISGRGEAERFFMFESSVNIVLSADYCK